MMRRAISLVELMVVVAITLVVLAAIYFAYLNLFKGFKTQSVSISSQIERNINLEIVRQDVEHAGFGIARDNPDRTEDLPVEYDAAHGRLILRSTYNVTNSKTQGWAMISCGTDGNIASVIVDELPDTYDCVVYLDLQGSFVAPGGACNIEVGNPCPPGAAGKVLLAFPYDSHVSSGCKNQYCTAIGYRLAASSVQPHHCAPGTKVFVRELLDSDGNPLGGGARNFIVFCVADFKVRYKWNGALIDPSTINPTLEQLTENLEEVRFYLLVQNSGKDTSFSFSGNLEVDGVELSYSSVRDGEHYRWKVVKLVTKPMNLKR